MSALVMAAIRSGVEQAGQRAMELPSGAGHDAAILAMAGVPSGMLFVRSDAGGVSHAAEEWTEPDAIAACVGALEPALRELAAA
jgi:N-carbamoyl-L-amino-acid hydrolase